MKRAISLTSILLFLLCACATTQFSWQKLTPKGRAAVALSTYNQAYDAYLQEAKIPNLSEQSKEMLRQKKKALTSLHEALKVYSDYVQKRMIPPEEIDGALVKALRPFVTIR